MKAWSISVPLGPPASLRTDTSEPGFRAHEVVAAAKGVGVFGAEGAFAGVEDLAVEVCGLSVLPQIVEAAGEVVTASQGLRVFGAEGAFGVAEDLVKESDGLSVLPHAAQAVGEVVTASQGLGVFGAEG